MGKFSKEEVERLVRIAAAEGAREGARVAIEKIEQERRKETESRQDRRLRNTKLLLRKYRVFKVAAEKAVYDANTLDESNESAMDILDLMMSSHSEKTNVEAIARSAARTAIIVQHIDTMLGAYKILCERSTKEEEQRYYRMIYGFYISDDAMSAEELAAAECISVRAVYKGIDCGLETLTNLIFGIDGLRFDTDSHGNQEQ